MSEDLGRTQDDADETIDYLLNMVQEWHELGKPERAADQLRRELRNTWSDGYFRGFAACAENRPGHADNPYRPRPSQ